MFANSRETGKLSIERWVINQKIRKKSDKKNRLSNGRNTCSLIVGSIQRNRGTVVIEVIKSLGDEQSILQKTKFKNWQ